MKMQGWNIILQQKVNVPVKIRKHIDIGTLQIPIFSPDNFRVQVLNLCHEWTMNRKMGTSLWKKAYCITEETVL